MKDIIMEIIVQAEEERNIEFKMNKGNTDKQLQFTSDELQLLYAACMSYGDKLSQILKSIPNEGEVVLDRLSDRAKDSWDLARKITGFME